MKAILSVLFLLFFSVSAFAYENNDVWAPYLQKIEKKLKTSWYEKSGLNRHDKECKINLYFNIKNSGEISGEKILFSSCNDNMNVLALQVLKNNAPFEPFPKKVSNIEEISIDFIFDYNLLPENKVNSTNINSLSNIANKETSVKENSVVNADKSLNIDNDVQYNLNNSKKDFYFKIFITLLILIILTAYFIFLSVKRKNN